MDPLCLITTISAAEPAAKAVSIPLWLDLSAVVVGSFSGILVAQDRKLDLVGHIALAMVCGLGGGLIRDVIMQVGDVYMLQSAYAIWVTIAAGVIGFLFPTLVSSAPRLLEWVDIISVGLFVAAGTDKAIVYELSPIASILMGVLTGVGGGMLRDVLLGDTPRIFKRSNYYAVCAIGGALVYELCFFVLEIDRRWAVVACVLVTVLIRRLSLRFNVVSHVDVDLTPTFTHAGRRLYQHVRPHTAHRTSASVARDEQESEQEKADGPDPGSPAS